MEYFHEKSKSRKNREMWLLGFYLALHLRMLHRNQSKPDSFWSARSRCEINGVLVSWLITEKGSKSLLFAISFDAPVNGDPRTSYSQHVLQIKLVNRRRHSATLFLIILLANRCHDRNAFFRNFSTRTVMRSTAGQPQNEYKFRKKLTSISLTACSVFQLEKAIILKQLNLTLTTWMQQLFPCMCRS